MVELILVIYAMFDTSLFNHHTIKILQY